MDSLHKFCQLKNGYAYDTGLRADLVVFSELIRRK